jgi:PAS domain S-box-containing protein
MEFSPRWTIAAILVWLGLSGIVFALVQLYIGQVRTATVDAAFARANTCGEALEQVMLRSTALVTDVQSLMQVRENILENGNKAGAAAISDHLRGVVAQRQSGILQISTVAVTGQSIWAADQNSQPIRLYDGEYLSSAAVGRQGVLISKPMLDPASGRWVVQFMRRLTGAGSATESLAVVSLDLAQLSASLGKLECGKNGDLAVWAMPDGQLVADSENADKLLGQAPKPDLPAIVAARSASSGSLKILDKVGGHMELQTYRTIADLPLVATVSLDGTNELSQIGLLATWANSASAWFALLIGALLALLVVSSARRRSTLELELVRREAEMTEAARTRIAQLLSGLPAAVYGINLAPNGAVVDFTMTETAQRLTGWDIGDLASRQAWVSRTFGIDEANWTTYYRKIIKDGEAIVEYRFLCRDGSIVWLRDQARVVKRGEDGQVSVVGYVSDITRERAIQAQAFASSKLATLGEMAAGLAHELNQPIATMSLAAENASHVLEQKGADGIMFAIQRMSRVVDQATRARTIINHLRIFGRQSHEEVGPVRVRAVVDGALAMAGSALRSAGVTVEVALEDDLPAVLAQLVLAEQVMVNLILNARDAMENNTVQQPRILSISAVYEEKAGSVVMSVRDSGPGIPQTLMDRIFEPFFTTKEAGKGTGLGLSLCHGIMGSFGGDISAENTRDGGAVFLVSFRCAPRQPDLEGMPDAKRAEVAA